MITRVTITSRIVLPVPPEQAWRAVVDWPRQGQWMLATRVRGGHGAGAQVVARTGIGPLGFTDAMVITHWEPPRRCVVAHTGRVIRGAGVFEVVPAGRRERQLQPLGPPQLAARPGRPVGLAGGPPAGAAGDGPFAAPFRAAGR